MQTSGAKFNLDNPLWLQQIETIISKSFKDQTTENQKKIDNILKEFKENRDRIKESSNPDKLKKMITDLVDIKTQNCDRLSTLFWIAKNNNTEMIKFMALIVPEMFDLRMHYGRTGETLIHLACYHNNVEIVKFIADNFPKDFKEALKEKNLGDSLTPLELASRYNRQEVKKFLEIIDFGKIPLNNINNQKPVMMGASTSSVASGETKAPLNVTNNQMPVTTGTSTASAAPDKFTAAMNSKANQAPSATPAINLKDAPSTSLNNLQPLIPKILVSVPPASSAGVAPLPINVGMLFREIENKTNISPTLPYDTNCRFTNILCPIETRVQVPGETKEMYLHANHVRLDNLQFILTQYPLPDQISLFWRASEKASLIVDLTNQNDMQKGLTSYAPNNDLDRDIIVLESYQNKTYGEVNVVYKKQETLDGINAHLYTYGLTDQGKEFEIPRLHYEDWKDAQGINVDDLDRIITVLESYQKDASRPFIIHCRAGVGRSGTLAVAFALYHLIRQKKVTADNLQEHLIRLILEGRRQRGPRFVQTEQQLEALCKWSWRALHRGLRAVWKTLPQ